MIEKIIGILCCLFILGTVLIAFSNYKRDLRFERGVIEPSVDFSDKANCLECFERGIECLNRNKIPSQERSGVLYISERDFEDAIMACS